MLDLVVRSKTRFDNEMLSLDIAELTHAVQERRVAAGVHRGFPRTVVKETDAPDFGLLGENSQRRCERGRAEHDEQLATLAHPITSSARSSSSCGIVSPSALAVLRLMTSSNFVGCSTGSSAGLDPLRILSTKTAARRKTSSRF